MTTNRIRLLRKAEGLSQKQFADLFSVDQTAVSNWERGKNSIDFTVADRIADYFSLPVEFVYGKSYTLARPRSTWSEQERALYGECHTAEAKTLCEFRLGRGVFEGREATARAIPSEEEIKAALFGGEHTVTDEMWREVKSFVAYIKQKNGQ